MTVRFLLGDSRKVLEALPDKSVHCCVTSPPYYGLRDYGVSGQIGLEKTPDEYVEELVSVFREVRRVLRDDGVLWLNLGDSYNNFRVSMGPGQAVHGRSNLNGKPAPETRKRGNQGFKEKDLIGIPWMVAFALRADGWYLRRDIIWSKSNPMPESCTDRPSTSHEYVFLLTKSARYFYDAEAIRESCESGPSDLKKMVEGKPRIGGKHKVLDDSMSKASRATNIGQKRSVGDAMGRNSRSVWMIATTSFPGAHFATFPAELPRRCIAAGTSEGGCCATCGAPYSRIVERGDADLEHQRACGGDAAGEYHGESTKGHAAAGVQDASAVKARILAGMRERRTAGWRPTCECETAPPVPCVVLDPFGGAGTTGMVADRMGRDAILIELNPEYRDMGARRITADAPLLAEVE